jgi:hypothetical protein
LWRTGSSSYSAAAHNTSSSCRRHRKTPFNHHACYHAEMTPRHMGKCTPEKDMTTLLHRGNILTPRPGTVLGEAPWNFALPA